MNDLPAKAKRKRKLGVAPTKPQFAPGCTHFAPKCTQCKTKGLLQNDSRELYQFLGHFTMKKNPLILKRNASNGVPPKIGGFFYLVIYIPCGSV